MYLLPYAVRWVYDPKVFESKEYIVYKNCEDIFMAFSNALKTFREGAGLSQKRLAESIGLDHSFICRLENGNRMPTRKALDTIAMGLNLNPLQADYLYKEAGFTYTGAMMEVPDMARTVLESAGGYPEDIIEHVDIVWRSLVALADASRKQEGTF